MKTPTLQDVKEWLGLEPEDTDDDVVLQDSLAAALEAQGRAVGYPRDEFGDVVMTADLVEAVFLRTQRLAARRNSPEGVVGLGGSDGLFTSARVPSGDPDVLRLEGPYLRMPVA
jgi:hypothetical protein